MGNVGTNKSVDRIWSILLEGRHILENTDMIDTSDISQEAMAEKKCRRSLYRQALVGVGLAALLSMSGCSASVQLGPQAVAGLTPDGTVTMDQIQVAYLASAGGGNGTLYYRGNVYPFSIGGLGVGGIGASTISAEGEVYKLGNLVTFPGTYGQARYGFAVGNLSGGDLWMQNQAGVIMHLKAKRTGLMLSLGGDAVHISMAQ
jgi:hypothetical protein